MTEKKTQDAARTDYADGLGQGDMKPPTSVDDAIASSVAARIDYHAVLGIYFNNAQVSEADRASLTKGLGKFIDTHPEENPLDCLASADAEFLARLFHDFGAHAAQRFGTAVAVAGALSGIVRGVVKVGMSSQYFTGLLNDIFQAEGFNAQASHAAPLHAQNLADLAKALGMDSADIPEEGLAELSEAWQKEFKKFEAKAGGGDGQEG